MLDTNSTEYAIAMELMDNCRIKNVELAQKLGVSRQTVSAKILELERKGIIRGYSTVVDPRALGYEIICIIGLDIDNTKTERIVQSLFSLEQVFLITVTSGAYDIEFFSCFHNNDELYTFLTEIIGAIEGVKELHVRHILREYWKPSLLTQKCYSLPLEKRVKITALDKKILEMLQNNARLSVATMAAHLQTSEQTVGKHLAALEANGTLRFYRADIDHTQLGLNVSALIEGKLERPGGFQVIPDLLQFKEVRIVNEITGIHDISIYVQTENMDSFRSFLHNGLGRIEELKDAKISIILKTIVKFHI